MKNIFLLLILLILSKNQFAQDIYNAFTLSKEIVRIEKEITDKNTITDSGKLEKILGLLLWYSDIENQKNSHESDYLPKILKEKYNTLYVKYSGIIAGLTNISKLSSLKKDDFDKFLEGKNFSDKSFVSTIRDLLLKREEYFENLTKSSNNSKTKKRVQEKLKFEIDSLVRDTLDLRVFIKDINVKDVVDSIEGSIQKNGNDIVNKSREADKNSLSINELENKISAYKSGIKSLNKKYDSIIKKNYTHPVILELGLYTSLLEPDPGRIGLFTESLNADQPINIQLIKESILSETYQSSPALRIPSQAEMIDAIAIYLAKRVKQESVMWFFETIKKNASQYDLIQTFFPNTIILLQSNEVYEIPNLGSQWRYALSKDFVRMPQNVFKSPWFKKWFKNQTTPEKLLFTYMDAGFDIADLLIQRYDYKNLIKQMYLKLNNAEVLEIERNNILPKDIFALLYGFNQECFITLKNKGDTLKSRMIKYEDLVTMSKEEIEIMLSLIDMKYGGCISKFFQLSKIDLKPDQVNSFRRWFGGIESGIAQFTKLQSEFVKTQELIKNGNTVEAIYTQFNVWENLFGLFNLIIPDISARPEWMVNMGKQVEKIKATTQKSFDVYHQITLKNYAGAVNSTLTLLEELFYSNDEMFIISKTSLDSNLKNKLGERPVIIDDLKSLKSDTNDSAIKFKRNEFAASIIFERERHAIQLIRKLAAFLNDVMLTTDSKKLAKVVESYALPPGSYKRKRNSWWSLDLNAFVGGFAGYEFARKKVNGSSNVLSNKGWVYGITAPIGISLSKTFGSRFHNTKTIKDEYIRNPDRLRIKKDNIYYRTNTTFTLTASIIDLGAVVSYRFNNTADSVLPQKPTWAQVFSPGINLAWGIKNTPLVVSFGYQYTPQLRRIDKLIPKEPQLNANRIALSLLFDLPLINLWQKSYIPPKTK